MKLHWQAVQKLAKAHHCEDPVADLNTFRRFLEFWWCRTYNKPMKDPLLKQYTLDELTYEYLRHLYHEPEMDPRKELEAKRVKEDDEAWVKQMMSQIKETRDQVKETEKSAEQAAPVVENAEITPEHPIYDPQGKPEAIPEALLPPDISTKFDDEE